MADSLMRKTVNGIKRIGQEQFDTFVQEMPFQRTKPLNDSIPKTKLVLFNTIDKKVISTAKMNLPLQPYIMSQLNVAGPVDIIWDTIHIQIGQFEVINPRETWERHPPAD